MASEANGHDWNKETELMAVADDIATERQRLVERLARIDAERQKLADQVAELDAAERVLSRMTPGRTGARRGR